MATRTRNDRYLTIPDVAARLNVSQRTVQRLIKTGSLPAVRVGDHWRVHEALLNSWVNANRAR